MIVINSFNFQVTTTKAFTKLKMKGISLHRKLHHVNTYKPGTLVEAGTHGIENRQSQLSIVALKCSCYNQATIINSHNTSISSTLVTNHVQSFVGILSTRNLSKQLLVQKLGYRVINQPILALTQRRGSGLEGLGEVNKSKRIRNIVVVGVGGKGFREFGKWRREKPRRTRTTQVESHLWGSFV